MLITANKSEVFERLFRLYNRHYLLRRAFSNVYLKGEIDPASPRPALYLMNHCSWWDGLLVYESIKQHSDRSHYMMMKEEQLRKYMFFRRIGVFSIHKEKTRHILESLQYAKQLLQAGHSVWIFPQGEIAHVEQRPLGFQQGTGLLLAQCSEAVAVPVTLYPMFGLHEKPEASMVFGAPIEHDWSRLDRRTITNLLENALTLQLEGHRQEMIAGINGLPPEYRPLLRSARSVNETFEYWKSGFKEMQK